MRVQRRRPRLARPAALLLGAAVFLAACGGSSNPTADPAPDDATTTTEAQPPAAETTTTTTTAPEPEPELVMVELEGFEERTVVFANIEFVITAVKTGNQDPRSYASGSEPVLDEANHYAYLDVTAINRMTWMIGRFDEAVYTLVLAGERIKPVRHPTFSNITGFLVADSSVHSHLIFPVAQGADLSGAELVLGSSPDRLQVLPLTGPVPPSPYPMEVEATGSADGVGPTNRGPLTFDLLGATLYIDRPHGQSNSPTGERADEGELFLVLHMRVTHTGSRGGENIAGAFRLLIDGIPRVPWDTAGRPGGGVTPNVFPGSAVDVYVAFMIPVDVTEVDLQVGHLDEDPGIIPIELPPLE